MMMYESSDYRARTCAGEVGVCGSECRAPSTEKKREFGLHGELGVRHFPKATRNALIIEIQASVAKGESITAICKILEINPRAYYRWISGEVNKEHHGGGGGVCEEASKPAMQENRI